MQIGRDIENHQEVTAEVRERHVPDEALDVVERLGRSLLRRHFTEEDGLHNVFGPEDRLGELERHYDWTSSTMC